MMLSNEDAAVLQYPPLNLLQVYFKRRTNKFRDGFNLLQAITYLNEGLGIRSDEVITTYCYYVFQQHICIRDAMFIYQKKHNIIFTYQKYAIDIQTKGFPDFFYFFIKQIVYSYIDKMETYLNNLFKDSSEREIALKHRKGFLLSLSSLFPNATDLTFLKHEKKVLQRVSDSNNPGTRYGRLIHIIKAIDMVPNVVSKKTRDRYIVLIKRLKSQKQALSDNNVLTDEQKARYLTLSIKCYTRAKLIELLDRYGMKRKITTDDIRRLKEVRDRKKGNIFIFAKESQELTIMAAYIWQPTLRNNWGSLNLVGSKAQARDKTMNCMLVKSNKIDIIMNSYKNDYSLGQKGNTNS
jgi:hypothetical protein